jgi:hypothetical protein
MINSTTILKIIEHIGNNPWLGILSFFVTVISIILAIYFFKKGMKTKKPRYTMISYNLVKDFANKIDGLEIRYSNNLIENFTVSKIAFWNAGSETINKEDVVPLDPISIQSKHGVLILNTKIIALNNRLNSFSLTENPNQTKVDINFDYIDKQNGVAIELFHTGTSHENIELCGTIKGVGKPKCVSQLDILDYLKISSVVLLSILALYIFIGISQYIILGEFDMNRSGDITISIVLAIAIILGISSQLYRSKFSKPSATLNEFFGKEPRGLEIIEENEYILRCDREQQDHLVNRHKG